MRTVRDPRSSERGLSLVELLFVVAMTGLVMTAVTTFVFRTRQGLLKAEVNAELQARATRIANNLRASINSSTALLADFGGNPDYAALQAWTDGTLYADASVPDPAPFSAHPTVMNNRIIGLGSTTSTAAANWGNRLLFVAALKPLTFTVKYGVGANDPVHVISVDRVQFVSLYLTLQPAKVAGVPALPRLVEWRSEPYIDYGAISDFTSTTAAPRLSETCKALYDFGYRWAVDMSKLEDATQAFYGIQRTTDPLLQLNGASGTGPGAPATAQWAYVDEYDFVSSYQASPGVSLGQVRRRSAASTAGPASFGLGLNTDKPTDTPALKVNALRGRGKLLSMPAHAQPDRDGMKGFPGGIEIAIVGHPQARELHLRFVTMGLAATDDRPGSKSFMADEGYVTIAVKNAY